MSMADIRETYGVPAKRGRRVRVCSGKFGKPMKDGYIASALGSRYLSIRSRDRWLGYFHPTDGVVYLNDDGTVLHDTREPNPTAAEVAGDER